jgi:hypothetical protein
MHKRLNTALSRGANDLNWALCFNFPLSHILWNYFLFEGTFILLGFSGKYGLSKVKNT